MTTAVLDSREYFNELFDALGYQGGRVRQEFPIWLGESVCRVEYAAFTSSDRADMTTAAIIGTSRSAQEFDLAIAAARALACPVVVSRTDEIAEVWAIGSDSVDRIDQAAANEPGALVTRFRAILEPRALERAKHQAHHQLALLPIDIKLLGQARSRSAFSLSSRIDAAIAEVMEPAILGGADVEQRLVDASRLVIGSLAALVVRDKFQADETGADLFAVADARFPGYFDWLPKLKTFSEDRVDTVMRLLGQDVDYTGLDSAVVSEVYEQAIVTQSERHNLSIFYTPPDLAKRVAASLPFEEAAPDARTVVDPACGSGTLLLAAHDRLDAIAPNELDGQGRHNYLVSHLSGFDMDEFAVQIARLSMLLHAMPSGNSWQIEHGDALQLGAARQLQPGFIISNPPWKDIRSKQGVRHQVADDFMRSMFGFLRPDGFLAMLLPASWLSSNTASTAREFLRTNADVFEVWRLPEGAFPSADMATCVVFAQKRRVERRQWVFRRVLSKRSLPRFLETGTPDETYYGDADREFDSEAYLQGPLSSAIDRLRDLPRLNSLVDITSGPVPEPPVAARGGSGPFLWLRHARKLPAFGEPDPANLLNVNFPADFHRAGTHNGAIYRRHKVLVSSKRSPDNPWRLKVGIDTRGIIPRESLYMATPAAGAQCTVHAIAAYLGSAFASCWVDSHETKMAIDARLLGAMRVVDDPHFWSEMDRLGGTLAADVQSGVGADGAVLRKVDDLVFAAIGLTTDEAQAVREHFAGFPAPEGGHRYQSRTGVSQSATSSARTLYGCVLGVEDYQLRMWVPGVTPEEGALVDVPESFKGWLARDGASFSVRIHGDDLNGAEFDFQPMTYTDFGIGIA